MGTYVILVALRRFWCIEQIWFPCSKHYIATKSYNWII